MNIPGDGDPMIVQLAVTPSGRVVAVESTRDENEAASDRADAAADERMEKRIAKRFARGQAEG